MLHIWPNHNFDSCSGYPGYNVWDYINLGYPHPGGEYQQEVERSAEGGPHLR